MSVITDAAMAYNMQETPSDHSQRMKTGNEIPAIQEENNRISLKDTTRLSYKDRALLTVQPEDTDEILFKTFAVSTEQLDEMESISLKTTGVSAQKLNETDDLSKNNDMSADKSDNSERISSTKNDTGTVPPDGGWGWMIVLGSFLVHVITDGILYSFGIFYIEFLEYYKGGKGETAWVGSLAASFQFFAGPLAGYFTDKFGCRFTTIVGSLTAALGFVLSSFSPNLYFLYFSFGILSGTGFCLTYFPAIVSVSRYFEKKRTFAVGLASCGSGIGTFIFNPVAKYLIDMYGWRGAILIQAGILLNCVICGAIFRPLVKQKASSSETVVVEKTQDKEENFALTGDDTGRKSCALHKKENQQEQQQLLTEEFQQSDSDTNTTTFRANLESKRAKIISFEDSQKKLTNTFCCVNIRSNLQHKMKQTCNLSPMKDVIFIMYLISNVLASLSLGIPLIFLYDRAIDQGIDSESAKWLGSIIGIGNTLGRVLSGILADKLKVDRLLLFTTTLTLCGIATGLCPLCFNYNLLVLFSCVYGLCLGIYVPLLSTVLVDLLGLEMLSFSFGLLLMLKGMAKVIGPPVAGWLYDATGSYDVPFIAGGITAIISGILLYSATCIKRYRKMRNLNQKSPLRRKSLLYEH